MKALYGLIEGLYGYSETKYHMGKGHMPIQINGCSESQFVHFAMSISKDVKQKIIITHSEKRARQIAEDASYFEDNVHVYPAKDFIFYNADIHGNLLLKERMKALRSLIRGENITIVTTMDAFMDKLLPAKRLKSSILSFEVGGEVDLDEVRSILVRTGYEFNSQVEDKGQCAIRGSIIDIFPLESDNPYRIDLWDTEIDNIKIFDVSTQRTIENIKEVQIYPATEYMYTSDEIQAGVKKIETELKKTYNTLRDELKTEQAHRLKETIKEFLELLDLDAKGINKDAYVNYFTNETANFFDYFDDDAIICVEEPARSFEHLNVVWEEFLDSSKHRLDDGYMLPGQMKNLYEPSDIINILSKRRSLFFTALDQKINEIKCKEKINVETNNTVIYNNDYEMLIRDIEFYKRQKYGIMILSASKTRAERLAGNLREYDINAFYTEDDRIPAAGEIMVRYGNLHRGFVYPSLKFVLISQNDIYGTVKKKKRHKKASGDVIKDFGSLNIGDYVVHESYGIGVYRGIVKAEVKGIVKDYIKIDYDGGSSLHVLASDLDQVAKYSGAEGVAPKLNKIGGQEWSKTRSRVKSAVKDIAADLIKLYAARENSEGFAFSEDSLWQKEFEEMFPYEETDDQLNAIDAVKSDMESKKTMDRLICGDVGYGKTEVAIRAAFKAVQDGKQVVFLVPTTILASQHYNTFASRFKDFPVRVDELSRFRTKKQVENTLTDLKKGFVDILIGTHRVLSKDVKFKDLGLLIIDEEQRFGVKHKEKIKELKNNIDVLCLSATPIPRTLHMSMIGIRDMSVLSEPPVDRMPVQTFVMEYNDEMVREAINRELSRNGQVYYVHNRVNNIEDIASKLQKLVPDANIAIAHGRMSERMLESVMYDFMNGDIDVLVSTTIIETGLDISNVNTMIIQDADRFGLSQLYQLKGRVGRSNRTSYAFLMYKRNKILKEVAEKRLQAIKDFTELGSGFKIAKRDLEIRGAGNVLGAEQHGHMEAVGYDLYCKMLNHAVAMYKGLSVPEEFETSIDIPIDAYIPKKYIEDEIARLNAYKKIAAIENDEEKDDLIDELTDRFGDIPKAVYSLLEVANIKAKAHNVYIKEIRGNLNELTCVLYEKAELDVSRFPEVLEKYSGKLKLIPEASPKLVYRKGRAMDGSAEIMETINGIIEALGEIKNS